MKYLLIFFVFLLFTTPITINAQVVISEIAWMGSNNGGTSGQNANDEWIELYNNGNEIIDLSGWSLIADDGSPSITLEGTINAKEFFLLERSDDNSVPSVIANLIYTGSLSNSGEILSIKDDGGVTIDTVDGTEGWQNIGGDNETKDTAQYISSGWTTASPTPGLANSGSGGEEENIQEEESSQSQGSSSSSSSFSSNFPTEQQIFADAGGDKIVVVGADTLFEGKALGLQKEPLQNARFVWNFGNGEIKESQNILHYYQYPGEYVVILNVSSGEYSAMDRIIVNAYPAELVISKIEKEFIEIHNESDRELNLSWWQLQSGNERFMIPKDTIILSGKKLIFSSDITGLDTSVGENVSLLYPNGVEAASFEQIKIPQKTVVIKKVAGKGLSSGSLPDSGAGEAERGETLRSDANLKIEEPKDSITQTASVISSINNQDKDSSMTKWLLAIFGIVLVSAGAVVFMGKGREKELSDEIEIIE